MLDKLSPDKHGGEKSKQLIPLVSIGLFHLLGRCVSSKCSASWALRRIVVQNMWWAYKLPHNGLSCVRLWFPVPSSPLCFFPSQAFLNDLCLMSSWDPADSTKDRKTEIGVKDCNFVSYYISIETRRVLDSGDVGCGVILKYMRKRSPQQMKKKEISLTRINERL